MSGSLDQNVIIWNMTSLTKISTFTPITAQIYCLIYQTDGSLAIAGKDQSVYYWNLTNQSAPFQINFYSNLITAPQKPFYSCMMYNNTIYLSNAKGYVNSLSPAVAIASHQTASFNSLDTRQINAIEYIGIILYWNTEFEGKITPRNRKTINNSGMIWKFSISKISIQFFSGFFSRNTVKHYRIDNFLSKSSF